MIYTILLEADKHWGAMTPEEQYRSSYILKRCLSDLPIDLYVNLGDFFDTKLLLNSKSSIYAVRDFNDKVAICRSKGTLVRAIKGTRGHDYNQWHIFDPLMADESNGFRYFETCTVEETLPGLRIWYAPEECMNYTEYVNTYADILMDKPIHMALFHGNFDKIIPEMVVNATDGDSTSTNLIFKYDEIATLVHGPLIAGHWHNGESYEHLQYVGSYDRWHFGEDEIKGFCIYQYNTETQEYRYVKVSNFLAPMYKTYEVYTSLYRSPEEYQLLIEAVEASLEIDPSVQVRIRIKINEEQPDTEQQISNLRFVFSSNKRVHIHIVNQIKKMNKKIEREKSKKLEDEYSYVRDKNMDIYTKLSLFIKRTTEHEYTPEEIKAVVEPYLKGHYGY